MTTWADLLDDYESTIATLEAALANGDVPGDLTAWRPPVEAAAAIPTEVERQRFGRLRMRAAACAAQLQEALDTAAADLDTTRRTGAAARTYGQLDHLTG